MTTTTDIPTAVWDTLEAALRQRRAVNIAYHRRQRTICPHALGWKNSRAMLLAYQTSSDSPATPPGQWRCFYLDHIEQIDPAEPTSKWATAETYNPAHPFNAIDTVTVAITA